MGYDNLFAQKTSCCDGRSHVLPRPKVEGAQCPIVKQLICYDVHLSSSR